MQIFTTRERTYELKAWLKNKQNVSCSQILLQMPPKKIVNASESSASTGKKLRRSQRLAKKRLENLGIEEG
jgi:hypothetical protein